MPNHLNDIISVFDGAPTGIILLSGDHRPEYCNPAAASLLTDIASAPLPLHLAEPRQPYHLDDNQDPLYLFHQIQLPSSLNWLDSELEDFAHSTSSSRCYEKTIADRYSHRHVQVTLQRRTDGAGRHRGTAVFIRDLTPQRLSEEALRTLEEKCRICFNNPFEGIVFTDMSGNILEGNEKMAEMLGCSVADLPKLDIRQLCPSEMQSEYLKRFQQIFQDGVGSMSSQWLRCRDHTTLPVDIDCSVLHYADKTVMRCIFRDISSRQRREMEQLRLDKIDSLGRLAGGIAHDFNNILTAIVGNITLALLDADLKPFCKERLQEAEKACLRAQGLTQQLLAFTKGGEPLKQTLSLDVLMEQILDEVSPELKSRVNYACPVDLKKIHADPAQLRQAIVNLLINADQSMPQGGLIRLTVENTSQPEDSGHLVPPGGYVKVSVADQGGGIPMQHLSQIFDPYFSTKDMRHGLGLAMVHTIIKNHAGFITVNTQPQAGTRFEIYLPTLNAAPPAPESVISQPIRGQGRILLMDDEAIIRDIVSRMIRKLGYEADVAAHGSEALSLYQRAQQEGRPYAAVIFDLTVSGGMGGKEALEKLRQIDPDVKAIVSSGYSDDPVMANYEMCGFRSVLAKPYKIVELSRVLHKVIN